MSIGRWQGFATIAAALKSNVNGSRNFGAAVAAYSDIIDLTAAPATYVIVEPTAARLFRTSLFWELKTVGGTRSVVPSYSVGSNAPNFDNMFTASAGNAALLTQAAETQATAATTGVSPIQAIDLTTSGLRLKITAAMTGVAPVCTARCILLGYMFPV